MAQVEEKWKVIPEEAGLSRYIVSNTGKVYNTTTKKTIKSYTDEDGNRSIKLWNDNDDDELSTYFVADLVLAAFVCLPNDVNDEGNQCVFIDGDKNNISLNNLQWSDVIHEFNGRRIKVSYIKNEAWTNLPTHMELSTYAVSSEGRIINVERNNILHPYLNKTGYTRISLKNNNRKRKTYSSHVLILESFISRPNIKGITVDHIDKNRSNNRLINLRWATKSEQAKNQDKSNVIQKGKEVYQYSLQGELIQKFNSINDAARTLNILAEHIRSSCKDILSSYGGFIWKFCQDVDIDLHGKWIPITSREECIDMYISSNGYIKKKDGTITNGYIKDNGYRYTSCTYNSKRIILPIHIIVAENFIGPAPSSKHVVNHINGIKDDPRAENLEWVTQQENIKHAFNNGLHKNIKGIEVIDLASNTIIESYISINEASRQLNILSQTLTKWTNSNDIVNDRYYRYTGSNVKSSGKIAITRSNNNASYRSVLVTDDEDNIIQEYKNTTVAAKAYGVSRKTIYNWCNSDQYNIKFKDEKNNPRIIGKAILQYSLNNIFIAEYKSANEAMKATSVNAKYIHRVCSGSRKTSGGFIWKYKEKYKIPIII